RCRVTRINGAADHGLDGAGGTSLRRRRRLSGGPGHDHHQGRGGGTELDDGTQSSGQPLWQPIKFEGSATDGGSVYQAGRDLTIIRKPDGPRRTRPGPDAREMQCPYPGLMPFGAEYRDWFYGRDQMIHTVLACVLTCRVR